jgi:hypothetical protein
MNRLRDEGRLVSHHEPFSDEEPLFELLEPNRNRVTLDGDELGFTLIQHRIAAAAVDEVMSIEELEARNELGVRELYERAFHGLQPIAPFSEDLGLSFIGGARQLIGLRRWHEQHPPWTVPSEAGQHFKDDITRFLTEARERLAPWSFLTHAVDFEAEVT